MQLPKTNGSSPKADLTSAPMQSGDRNTEEMGPCEITESSGSGTPGYVSVPPGAALGLLLVFKNWDVSLVFLRKFAVIICKPGSLAWFTPENSSRAMYLLAFALFWYQDISTWKRLY